MKKLKKCDTGGGLEQLLPLLPTALGAINPALGIAANVGIQGLSSMKQEAPVIPDTTYNVNPYGKMKTGGKLKSPPKKKDVIYSGGTLPEFTVIAQKKENSSIDPFTYKNLVDIQNTGDKQVYDIWKSSGKPKINISDWANRQTYESDTQSLDIGRNDGGIVENFLSEIPHAIQNTYYYPGDALQKKYESDVQINKTFTPEQKQKLYNIPGTLEHEAHSIIEPQVRKAYTETVNNKRMFNNGGLLPAGFTQHDSPSHADGGQSVDAQGKPNMVAPVAEIQNKENVYNNYVYSDMLKNPKTGKTFNIDMQKLAKKYKNADTDLLSKTALNISADNLAKTNDLVRTVTEQAQTASEQLPQAPYGIDLEPLPTLPINIVPGQVGVPSVPQEQNMNLPHIQNPFETMSGLPAISPLEASVPPGQNPWEGVTATPLTSLPTEFNRRQSVLSYMKSSLNPNTAVKFKQYDDNAYNDGSLTINNSLGISTPRENLVAGTYDDKSGVPDVKERGFNYNTAALVAKGLGFAGSVANALKPAKKENLILPDYNPADASFDRASIDYTQAEQDVLGASNILGATNRNASSGFGQYRNREAARIANVMDNIGNIKMQERNANSQLDLSRGQYRAGKAQDIANRTYQNNIDNLQNEAVSQQFKDQMFSELTQIGSSLNKYETFKQELANMKDIASLNLNQFSALAKARGLNFSIGEAEEFLKNIKEGNNPIQFIK